MPEPKPAPKPDDLATPYTLTPDECFVWGDESEYGIQDGGRPRATAIDNFAREYGIAFKDVRCRRAYIAFFTRQESWEARAQEHAIGCWIDNHDPPLTLSGEDFQYRTPDGTVVKPPDLPVPDDWSPGEGDPVWSFCEKGAPGAVPCWVCEERTTASTPKRGDDQ